MEKWIGNVALLSMDKRFRISLSFAGEKRSYVSDIARILADRFGEEAILYDHFHRAELARADLAIYLPTLYHEQSDLVVGIFCADYDNKEWCGLEWRAIYSLLKKRQDEHVMLMRFDNVEPAGLYGLPGYVDLDQVSPADAAALIFERLALNEGRPRDFYKDPRDSGPSADHCSRLLVRSFPTAPEALPDLALPPLDLTDLFNGRDPIDDMVWSQALPQRLEAAMTKIRRLPQPLRITAHTHLSIGWFLGTRLNPKAGFRVEILQASAGLQQHWALGPAARPANADGWRLESVSRGSGTDLILLISVSKSILADVLPAIPRLGLSPAAILHACLPQPGNGAIVDGSHARWLADELIRSIHDLRAKLRTRHLHLFAACPVGLMLLLGQQVEACGPTTVWEFAYGAATSSYRPGMTIKSF